MTFRTSAGKGMVTDRVSRVGALELPLLLALPKENGVVLDVDRPGPDGFEDATPGKLVFSVKRASKSVPLAPKLERRSTVAGRKMRSERLGGWSVSSSEGSRSVV